MRKALSLTLMVILLPLLQSAGQTGTVKGRVLDAETDAPLAGATILLFEDGGAGEYEPRTPINPRLGRISNRNGDFEYEKLEAGEYTIRVTYVGYREHVEDITVEAGKSTTLVFGMLPDIIGLQEVVVSGAASRTQKEVAEVAVARLNADALTKLTSYNDIGQLLTGKVPGVQVQSTSGNLGGAIKFDVRSGAGLLGGQPVIYVDGVRMINSQYGFNTGGQLSSTLVDINPQYIQRIEVLKGPAASALYGTSGANGVVLISTREGARNMAVGDYRLWYRFTTGWNEQLNEYTEDYARSYRDANAVFRDGSIVEHAFGVSGNAGLFNYFLAYENRAEDGILIQNGMHRHSVRANFSAFPSDVLSIDVHTNYTFNSIRRPMNDNNILGWFGNTVVFGPVDAGGPGSYAWTDSTAIAGIGSVSDVNHITGSVLANWTPVEHLMFRGVIGYDGFLNREDETFPMNEDYTGVGIINGARQVAHGQRRAFNIDLSAAYSWDPIDGLHALSTLGMQGYQMTTQTVDFAKMDFPSRLITNIGAGTEFQGGDESFIQLREAGVFFQQDFSLYDVYYFSAGVRNDYASSVGETAPSIFYPRFSGAVRIDRLELLPAALNFVKVRAAYGESGILPDVLDASALRWGGLQSGAGAGAVITSIGNAAIEPERTREIELGFEAEYERAFGVDLSYYWRFGRNAIVYFENPPSTGLTATAVPRNVGAIDGWGFESSLYGRPLYSRDVQLSFNLIYNYANNEVKDLGGAAPLFSGLNAVAEGYPRSAFYAITTRGALFDENGAYAGPDVDTARTYIGTPVSPHTMSLRLTLTLFQDLTLSALMQGAWGGTMFNMTRMFGTFYNNNLEYARLATQLDIAGQVGVQPVEGAGKLEPGTAAYISAAHRFARLIPGGTRGMDFFEDSDYFRISEISLRYDLTGLLGELFDRRHVRSLALILSARNLFLTTKYSGPDVEINTASSTSIYRGVDFLTLQNPRVYNLTLSIGL